MSAVHGHLCSNCGKVSNLDGLVYLKILPVLGLCNLMLRLCQSRRYLKLRTILIGLLYYRSIRMSLSLLGLLLIGILSTVLTL